jgi:hypothetical protein
MSPRVKLGFHVKGFGHMVNRDCSRVYYLVPYTMGNGHPDTTPEKNANPDPSSEKNADPDPTLCLILYKLFIT